MFKKILLGLLVLVIVLVVVILMQPAKYHVERSASMAAAPPALFDQVNDFHNWDNWSPWAKLDPDMKTTHEGPAAGTGAIYSWSGNDEVGEGKMTIVESKPGELVRIKLEFLKPFEGVCETKFTFKPDGKDTMVTWSMDGENNFVGKAFSLFMNTDKMIGDDFDKGLSNMKKVVEEGPKEKKPTENKKTEDKTKEKVEAKE